jgi:hypothetical protein
MIAVAGAAIVCATLPRSSAGSRRFFPSGVVTNTNRAGRRCSTWGPFHQLVDRVQRLAGDGASAQARRVRAVRKNNVESVVGKRHEDSSEARGSAAAPGRGGTPW